MRLTLQTVLSLGLLMNPSLLAGGETLQHPARIVPPPKDAVVVFDGRNADGFTEVNGKPASWKVEEACLLVGGSDIVTKAEFDNAQIHVEFSLPPGDKGHGNSGLYIHHTFEVQILDSSLEKPYAGPAQQCGSLYQTFPPMVNVCTPPETWQSYDILFHGAKLDEQGKVQRPARITVIQNGVVVQDNRELPQGTGAGKSRKMVEKGPLRIQAHGAPVKLRNLWILPIADINEQTASPNPAKRDNEYAKKVSPGFWDEEHNHHTPPEDAQVLYHGNLDKGWNSPPLTDFKTTEHPHSFLVNHGSVVSNAVLHHDQLHLEWKSDGETQIALQLGDYSLPLVTPEKVLEPRWRTLDVLFQAPTFNQDQEPLTPGHVTILVDGIVVTDHTQLPKEWAAALSTGQGDKEKPGAQLVLSAGSKGTEYRNLWLRSLEIPEGTKVPEQKKPEPKKTEPKPSEPGKAEPKSSEPNTPETNQGEPAKP